MKSTSSKIHSLRPITYFEELAQSNLLEEYLQTELKDRYENDETFRVNMQAILYKYAETTMPNIEALFLNELNDSLNYFLEHTKKWKDQKR